MTITKKDDWKTEEFPEKYSTISLDKELTEEEFQQVQKGLIPEVMEDKWFIYFEDNWLLTPDSNVTTKQE